MKTYSLKYLAAVMCLTAGPVAAAEVVVLVPDRLEAVVGQLESAYEKAGTKAQMPPLVYAPGMLDVPIEAPLRLGTVKPVDALALIAAAAGCRLEPVFSPEEEGEPEQRIVGYSFVNAATQPTLGGFGGGMGGSSGESEAGPSGIGVALEARDGGIFISQVLPGTVVAKSGLLKVGDRVLTAGDEGAQAVAVSRMPLEEVVDLVRGAAGTAVELTVVTEAEPGATPRVVKVVRERLPILTRQGSAPIVKVVQPSPPGDDSKAAIQRAKDANRPTVRIHALGDLLSGSEEEAREKQDALALLVAQALEMSDENEERNPDLSFHGKSGALIVRATERQHEVVLQALTAMKEHRGSTSVLKR